MFCSFTIHEIWYCTFLNNLISIIFHFTKFRSLLAFFKLATLASLKPDFVPLSLPQHQVKSCQNSQNRKPSLKNSSWELWSMRNASSQAAGGPTQPHTGMWPQVKIIYSFNYAKTTPSSPGQWYKLERGTTSGWAAMAEYPMTATSRQQSRCLIRRESKAECFTPLRLVLSI